VSRVSEQLYAVSFEDSGATYVDSVFATRSEAEDLMERLEVERYEELVVYGVIGGPEEYENFYSVEELDPEILSEDDQRMLENGEVIELR
jgi:predicted nucleotidyltransferase